MLPTVALRRPVGLLVGRTAARRAWDERDWRRRYARRICNPRYDHPVTDTQHPFVPTGFLVPREHVAGGFHLAPLGPEHNLADLAAWSSSIDHIRRTPGFAHASWPREMSADENRADLERHARDFAERTGFTYTVLTADGTLIGCIYIYPPRNDGHDARVRSWVRAADADRDVDLYRVVVDWLADAWPFANPEYAVRPGADTPPGR